MASDLAASVGRRFDPEKYESGYSDTFEPELLEEYNKQVAEGRINPDALGRGESNLDIANREPQRTPSKRKTRV